MNRSATSSSLIKSIGYENSEMHVEFHNGKVYRYTGPLVEQHYKDLLTATSMGKHFGKHVRSCPFTKCEPL